MTVDEYVLTDSGFRAVETVLDGECKGRVLTATDLYPGWESVPPIEQLFIDGKWKTVNPKVYAAWLAAYQAGVAAGREAASQPQATL